MSNFVSNDNATALMDAIGKKKLTVTDVMPLAASAANEGIPYLYIGVTTQDFTNGSIYESQEVTPATDPKTYEWVEKYQSNVDLTYYKRIWGGTEAGWEALTDEQKANYEYTFFDDDVDNYLTVVDTVEDGNMHAVTSNAVAEEVDAIDAETSDIVNIYGSKNLLLFDIENIKAVNPSGTWNGNSYTYLGITYTLVLNDDGTLAYVEANGTANPNAQAQFHFTRESLGKKVYMPEGHILMSGCPSGGSDPTFSQVLYYDGVWYIDIGLSSGKDIDIADPTKAVDFYINIKNGTTVDHQRYYPMLRRSSIKDGSYVPYAMTNKKLTLDKMSYQDNGILGAKNLWDINSVHPTGGNGGGSASYSNGVITVNCPAVLNSGAYITGSQLRNKFANLNGLPIIISFDVKGDSSFNATVGPEVGGTAEAVSLSTSYLHKEYLFNGADDIKTLIFYTQDASQTHTITVTNFMLRLATDNDSTYQSYAMTNKQLTDAYGLISRRFDVIIQNAFSTVALPDDWQTGYRFIYVLMNYNNMEYLLAPTTLPTESLAIGKEYAISYNDGQTTLVVTFIIDSSNNVTVIRKKDPNTKLTGAWFCLMR